MKQGMRGASLAALLVLSAMGCAEQEADDALGERRPNKSVSRTSTSAQTWACLLIRFAYSCHARAEWPSSPRLFSRRRRRQPPKQRILAEPRSA